jgi:radical SAM protein with 4Fe4S-binding SPASM domain
MAVNVDGTISICCVDWAHETVIGNVNEESLDAIWTGERMREFRKLQLEGRRNHNPACANCSYVQGMPESSDLDTFKDRLMPIYDS